MNNDQPAVMFGRYNFVKTGLGVFAMDDGRLLLKKNGESYPCPLSGQETHALYNLLHDHLRDIIAANMAARKFGTGNGRGEHKKQKKTVDSK